MEHEINTAEEVRFSNRRFEIEVRRALEKPDGPVYVSELASIEKLELDEEDHIEDIEYIQYCTGLKELFISLSIPHGDARFIEGLTSLETLSVDTVGDGDFDYGVFAGLRNLKSLSIGYIWFWNVTHSNFPALKNLTHLNDLLITEAEYIDIAAVCEIPELESFDLSFIGKVDNVEAVSRIPKLKYLCMCDVKIESLDFLEKLDPSVELELISIESEKKVTREELARVLSRFAKCDAKAIDEFPGSLFID